MSDRPVDDSQVDPGRGDVGLRTYGRRDRSPQAYWKQNIRYVGILLGIWFLVSYGAGILLAERLDGLRVPGTGFPVGFWFAQQGSIYVFVVLIFVYVVLMNRLDREFEVDEGDDE